jgi:hypothetical protein
VRALDRDHVGRLLDHADHLRIAAFIGADPATRPVREVEAGLAQPDSLFDLGDRARERERLLVARPEQMERQPLRRTATDPGQFRQLGDQSLYGRGVDAQRTVL